MDQYGGFCTHALNMKFCRQYTVNQTSKMIYNTLYVHVCIKSRLSHLPKSTVPYSTTIATTYEPTNVPQLSTTIATRLYGVGLYSQSLRAAIVATVATVAIRSYGTVPTLPYRTLGQMCKSTFFTYMNIWSVIYRFTRLVNSILPAKFHVRSMRTEAAILI